MSHVSQLKESTFSRIWKESGNFLEIVEHFCTNLNNFVHFWTFLYIQLFYLLNCFGNVYIQYACVVHDIENQNQWLWAWVTVHLLLGYRLILVTPASVHKMAVFESGLYRLIWFAVQMCLHKMRRVSIFWLDGATKSSNDRLAYIWHSIFPKLTFLKNYFFPWWETKHPILT